jgi:TetR/AcrR family transcriptional repressor of nem operon
MGRPKHFDPDTAVEQAMQVFWSKGYAGTTPQDLVDALGIGKGSLYNAFGSKQGLFERALARYREFQNDAIAQVLEQPGLVRDRLRAGFTYLVDANFRGHQPRGCFAVNTAAELGGIDEMATEQVRRSFDRTESAFRVAIAEGQASGELEPDLDAEATASLLLAASVAIQLVARTATGPERMRRIADAALAQI